MSIMAVEKLSKKEAEWCKYFVETKGKEYRIAKLMGITEATTKTHKSNIFLKLLVNDKTQLMHYLLTEHWLPETSYDITKTDNDKYNLTINDMQNFIKRIIKMENETCKIQ